MHRYMLLLGLGAALLTGCDKGPKEPMAQAAAANDAATLRRLLTTGSKADGPGEGWTPLIWASRAGAVDAIKVLLDAGADINHPGPSGDNWDATPLQHAILERQPRAVEVLLERGADVHLAGAGSQPPIFLAAGDADPTIVKLLLAHGASATVENQKGATPFVLAVSAGSLHGPDRPMFGGCRTETVRAFLARDPALRVKHNDAGTDALWWARFQRCEEVLRLIGE
jgi:uncharacterized protein